MRRSCNLEPQKSVLINLLPGPNDNIYGPTPRSDSSDTELKFSNSICLLKIISIDFFCSNCHLFRWSQIFQCHCWSEDSAGLVNKFFWILDVTQLPEPPRWKRNITFDIKHSFPSLNQRNWQICWFKRIDYEASNIFSLAMQNVLQ